MNKHSVGPWHQGAGNGEGSIFADCGRTRLEEGGTTLYPIASVNIGFDQEEDEANAALIAAAPDLLKALDKINLLLHRTKPDHPTLEGEIRALAIAAITKARS